MDEERASGFLPDGRERLLRHPDALRERERIERELNDRYAPLLAEAGPCRRLILRYRRRRELCRQLDRLAPSAGCYSHHRIRGPRARDGRGGG